MDHEAVSLDVVTKMLAEAFTAVLTKGIKPVVIENPDKILDVDGAAEFLGVSPATINRLIRERDIPYFKIKGCNKFTIRELERYVEERMIRPNDSRKSKRAKTGGTGT